MRFLIDAQLPPALARLLDEHGHQADHVNQIGPGDTPDRVVWQYSLDHDAVIVTKDEDFADMMAIGAEGPPVVWIRIGNTRSAVFLRWFEPLIDEIVEMVGNGQRATGNGSSNSADSCGHKPMPGVRGSSGRPGSAPAA